MNDEKQNKKALKKETVLVILKDQKNAKVNKELRKQVFNNYCGIYTNVVILKDTDIKIGGELRMLRGMSFDSIILKCFLATPIYEYLHEVLFMKMLQSIEKDIRNLPNLRTKQSDDRLASIIDIRGIDEKDKD